MENVRTKCIIFCEALRLGSNNLNKICLKIIQNAPKQPLQHVNFQKFFEGACSRTPLRLSCFSISFKFVFPKKILLQKVWKLWLGPPFKISRYATIHYHWSSSSNQSEKSHGANENRLHSKYLTICR